MDVARPSFVPLFLGLWKCCLCQNKSFPEFDFTQCECIEMSCFNLCFSQVKLPYQDISWNFSFQNPSRTYPFEEVITVCKTIWQGMIELGAPLLISNPYGRSMIEILESVTLLQHRTENITEIYMEQTSTHRPTYRISSRLRSYHLPVKLTPIIDMVDGNNLSH